jgi:16S rRNA (cytosine967-C5)-methyltransferase
LYIAQQIAALAVSKVLAGKNLTMALPEAQAAFGKATPQQRGASADLSYGTLRFYGEIQAYLSRLLEKPLNDAKINALLAVALYQLLHDSADDFTIVNQAVNAASYAKPKWAKGLVNGVLRNFLRQKEALSHSFIGNDEVQYSYPQWWIDKVKKQYPSNWQAILKAGNEHPPLTLRVNQQKITTSEYRTLLTRQGIEAEQIGPQAIMLKQAVPVEKLIGFEDGVVSVQDLGAQLAADLLPVEAGMRVLDACCAPGGKTGHILEKTAVKLTALDSDATRIEKVASNLKRLSLSAELKLGDASLSDWHDGQLFDCILADVPCSASGIVRRHVDMKWLRRNTDIKTFTQQQRAILFNLWQLLQKGGKLLYVTCSIFDEENQQQINQFMEAHNDATLLQMNMEPFQTLGMQMQGQQLIPSALHDGLYYALLQKA